jgi:hypothetical protein
MGDAYFKQVRVSGLLLVIVLAYGLLVIRLALGGFLEFIRPPLGSKV